MQFVDLVTNIADILKEYDSEMPTHRSFRPGIGPFGEPQIVGEIARRLTLRGIKSITKRTPDLEVVDDWAIEFKIVRPFGDNGREAENWSVNLLHPYAGNVSLIGDAMKLLRYETHGQKGVIIIGFEHEAVKISLDPLLNSFELITRQVMNIELGDRIEVTRGQLTHPEHQVLRCIGWPLGKLQKW
jgi:hypothetical protein